MGFTYRSDPERVEMENQPTIQSAALLYGAGLPKLNCCTFPPATATTESTEDDEAQVEDLNDPHCNTYEALRNF